MVEVKCSSSTSLSPLGAVRVRVSERVYVIGTRHVKSPISVQKKPSSKAPATSSLPRRGMFASPAKFQNASSQTHDPPPPAPHSRPVTPQPSPARTASICVVLAGAAAPALTSASAATTLIMAITILTGSPSAVPRVIEAAYPSAGQ